MRSAGLPVEVMIEYLRLFQEGDSTIPARLDLLNEQMDALRAQKAAKGATVKAGLAIHGSDVDNAKAKLKGWA